MRTLTTEVADLKEQLAQQQQRLQRDAKKEVCIICLLHARLRILRLHQLLQHRSWHLDLCIRLPSRDVRGRNHLVDLLCATHERQKDPPALKLNAVCLYWHACAALLRPD